MPDLVNIIKDYVIIRIVITWYGNAMSVSQQQLEFAEKALAAYGKLLSAIEPSFYGLPLSKLPYTINEIKDSIYTVLNTIDKNDQQIIDSLTNAYMFLGQFIPDDELLIVQQALGNLKDSSKASPDTSNIEQAGFITSRIKVKMENNLEEIQLFLSEKTSLKT